jgi:SlyX protein
MTDHDLSEEVDERFQVLENKVIHQEYLVDELNTVVTRQQDQIDALIAEVKKIRSAMTEQTDRLVDAGEEPPPPHY